MSVSNRIIPPSEGDAGALRYDATGYGSMQQDSMRHDTASCGGRRWKTAPYDGISCDALRYESLQQDVERRTIRRAANASDM